MPRVKSNVARLKRKNKIMKLAKGFFGGRSKLWKAAKESVERAQKYAYRDRRLQDLKTEVLGRKAGALTELLTTLPQLEPASRKAVGAAANALKREFEAAFEARERELKRAPDRAAGPDLTMPGRAQWRGGLHLVTPVVDAVCEIFPELGFTRAGGPET